MANIAFKTYVQALTNKATPTGADSMVIIDSADSNNDKETTMTGIYNYFKSLYDSVYQAVLVSGTNIKTVNGSSLLGSGDVSISTTVSDGDKGDITVSSSGSVWEIDAGVVGVTELSASGSPSSATFLRGDNTWAAPAGGGDVSKVGTPVNNQIGVWTGDGTIEGDAELTFDTSTNTLNIAPVSLDGIVGTHSVKSDASSGLLIEANNGTDVSLLGVGNTANVTHYGVHQFPTGGVQIGSSVPFADSAGTLTLQNVDALDATTEATIEAAIDTLANLTSIQGRTVTLADAGADAILGWDDSASAYQNLSAADARAALGLATSDSPEFTSLNVGNSSDTTLSRAGAGDLAVEGVSVLTTSNTKTVTGKRVQPRTASSTTASTLTPDLSSANVYYRTTQTATLTIEAPIGTPVIGETIMIYVDSAGAQTLTINSTYKAFGAAFPATTTAGKTFMMSAQYNGTDWKTLWANAV